MKSVHILVCATALLGTVGSVEPARAEDSMRCGSKLVSQGDGKHKVRTLCGEPSDVVFRGMVRRSPTYRYDYGVYEYDYYGPGWLDLPVEVWTYNLGPHKLLRKLRFVGDELDNIETAGYGY